MCRVEELLRRVMGDGVCRVEVKAMKGGRPQYMEVTALGVSVYPDGIGERRRATYLPAVGIGSEYVVGV